jgi:hypothetical protein
MHLVGYLHEDYHDARSLEHKVMNCISPYMVILMLKIKCDEILINLLCSITHILIFIMIIFYFC